LPYQESSSPGGARKPGDKLTGLRMRARAAGRARGGARGRRQRTPVRWLDMVGTALPAQDSRRCRESEPARSSSWHLARPSCYRNVLPKKGGNPFQSGLGSGSLGKNNQNRSAISWRRRHCLPLLRPLLHRERPNGMFTYSDAAVVAAAIALFALITAAIHYSGIMQPGWSLF
jgi:hypothetical protein